MKVYCIIPTYNEEAFIAQTLNSLVQQTVVPDKIIVVNDNSTDKTADIITTLKAFILILHRFSTSLKTSIYREVKLSEHSIKGLKP